MHRDAVLIASKLKNAVDGTYLWSDALKVGEPDTLLGAAVYESEYAPNTFTTGLYVMIYGDLSFYWWADSLQMEVQRLEEKYAETHQIGFIGRLESDGAPVMAEAFARLKLA
jgi:HK97 family phage major capsid protein